MIRALLLSACLLPCALSAPQDPVKAQERPAPRQGDVASVESIVAALYEAISGPAGAARDWQRFHSLFHGKAQLIAMVRRASGLSAMHLSPKEYQERSAPRLEKDGFFEQEIARRIDRFGDIAQVFSTYEARRARGDEKPFLRGINSIQLCREQDRWWVLSVLWEQEADAGPIPAAYLPK